ncbi:acyltransferase family protein [Rhizobium sp. BR 315]|uniref:acyltransferase family protein n=1 Tax=Rhizobium sp. BR 315 TaxID=3040014 RepID=UPI003D329528
MERTPRRYDLDFVRVAAFMLLIIYHVSLIYDSREFLLKAPQTFPLFDMIHLWTHPWRMSLLFIISGTVTGILLTRQSPDELRSARTRQLLIPLLLGLLFLIPPQMYISLNAGLGVNISLYDVFWHYVTWTPVQLPDGGYVELAGMQHLWYLAYLWVYTALLTLALSAWPRLLTNAGDRLAIWLTGKWILILPALYFVLLRLVLRPAFPPTPNMLDDWYSHAVYVTSFFVAAAMAMRNDYWDAIVNMRRPALILAVASAVAMTLLFPALPAVEPEGVQALAGRILAGTFQWCAIVAILGYAKIWCNSENAVIRYLNRAILTYYVLHQTVMLLIAYALDQMGLMSVSFFIPIAVATLAICALLYELRRHLEASYKAMFPARFA